MGQKAAKPAWLKPAGGYQTVTGGSYGRRHAYVGPSLNSQDRDEHEHNEDSRRLEFEDVQRESSLCMCISLCRCYLIMNWDAWG